MRGLPPQQCLYSSPQHQTCSALRELIRRERLSDIFIVTRSPYDRLKSEFNWHFRDTPQEERPCYSAWVMESLQAAKQDRHYMDNHFRPAVDYLDLDFPTKIFRAEDGLAAIVELFIQPIGSAQNINLLHLKNSSAFANTSKDLELDSQALDAVNQFYFYDFLAFDYPWAVASASNKETIRFAASNTEEELNAKVAIAKQWHEETRDQLLAKLKAQCINLSAQLESINSSIFDSHAHLSSRGPIDSSTICCAYDNILLRLSQTKIRLEEAFASPADKSLSVESARMIAAIANYRQRIMSSAALAASHEVV